MSRPLGPLPGCALLDEQLRVRAMTQESLEKLLEVTEGLVSRWLSGSRRPSLEMACRIRDLVGVPVDAWRRDTEEAETDSDDDAA